MRFNIYLPRHTGLGQPHNTLRRCLRGIGVTWSSAPVRRVFQGLAFVLFLILFFYVAWPYGSPDYAETLSSKEHVEAEAFLALDPLVSISTALAAKAWVWSLTWAVILLGLCLLVPRGFCGYLCPLGTLIDLFDWAIGRRVPWEPVEEHGWWVHLKYYILAGTLVAALFGFLLTGFVAAIPVITRGMQFLLGPVQMGILRGWYLVPPMNAGHYISISLFLGVLMLGLLGPRFWCRYVCPTGAVLSVMNRFRTTERKVESSCIHCNRCVNVCPFDAIKADFNTRTADCTFCQTCGGVCPTHSIQFVGRWQSVSEKAKNEPPTHETPLSRRGFLTSTAVGLAMVAGNHTLLGADLDVPAAQLPVRPPGSVPERQFLQMCIRCGECFKACPNNVIQPMGFEQNLDGLWTPRVVADWSGCEPQCNNCGQVCPTGAIRALPLEEKRAARMGLAIVDEEACLPYAGTAACQLCVDECAAAGYDAIEFMRVGVEIDAQGNPIGESGYLAPVVLAEKCVGCGLCQTRCYAINVREQHLLVRSAVQVEAGPDREDRLMTGSYIALREKERKAQNPTSSDPATDSYLPDFLQ